MQRTSFSDDERAVIEKVAQERGITFEEAANELASEGLAKRVKRRTGHRPASNVRNFRRLN